MRKPRRVSTLVAAWEDGAFNKLDRDECFAGGDANTVEDGQLLLLRRGSTGRGGEGAAFSAAP